MILNLSFRFLLISGEEMGDALVLLFYHVIDLYFWCLGSRQ